MPSSSLRARPRALAVVRYRRVLVPVWTNGDAARTLDLACRLAAETRSAVSMVAAIEVPPELPLDAHMREAEAEARRVLTEAQAIADSYGVGSSTRALRGRDAGEVLTEEARRARSEVIGAARRDGAGRTRARRSSAGRSSSCSCTPRAAS